MRQSTNASKWMRQLHRWLSIAFTLTVLVNIVAHASGDHEPAAIITYSPLAPLAVLLLSGLYLFMLPYAAKWRTSKTMKTTSRTAL